MILGRQSKCLHGCCDKLQRIYTQIVSPQPHLSSIALAALDEPPSAFRDPLGNRACVRKRRAIRTRGVLTALDARLETCNGLSFAGFLLVVVVVMRVDEVGWVV
jgi:hypothetical protein